MTSGWDDSGWYDPTGGARDPHDPNTWTPQERVNLLFSLGFQWIAGNAESAVWRAPSGERMAEGAALRAAGLGSVPQAPRPTAGGQGDTSAQVDGAGMPYVIRNGLAYTLDGQPYVPKAVAQNPHPGYSVSQSYTDPRSLDIQSRQLDQAWALAQQKSGEAADKSAWDQVTYWQDRADKLAAAREEIRQKREATGVTSANNAADRAARAAEFATVEQRNNAELTARNQQAGRQQALAEQQQKERERLDYANLVSSTDTAALPAYLKMGGGNYFNAAAANPNGALTDNAMLPAASILRAQDERAKAEQAAADAQRQYNEDWYGRPGMSPNNLNRPGYGKDAFAQPGAQGGPRPGFEFGVTGGNPATAQWRAQTQANDINARAASLPGSVMSSQPGLPGNGGSPGVDYSDAAMMQRIAASRAAGSGAGGSIPGFAGGTQYGFIPAPQQGFITGEQGPEYQQVYDPPGANNAQLRVVPGFALGTDLASVNATGGPQNPNVAPAGAGSVMSADPAANSAATSVDQPYIQAVREFRQSQAPLDVGFSQLDPRFSRRLGPTLQTAYWRNAQTRTGVPAADLAAEAAYYTPRGASRGFSQFY